MKTEIENTLREALALKDAEIERLRMQLAACGCVALADTPESAVYTRNMHPDYRSASCDEVARRVDECMALRLDAGRYRWLRTQHWSTSPLCVVADPKDAVKLAYCCPSGDLLDTHIDDLMAHEQDVERAA
jgi:hypothetical protein